MTLKNILITSIAMILWIFPLFSQIEGDNIFLEDQVITIALDFAQESFWDSLTTNYATETYMKADLTLTDNSGTTTFPDVGVRLKGNSSYGHPGQKKSFKIDFNKYVSGQNYDGLKKLNFSNGFKDPSLMREKIFFDLCQEANIAAPRANYANVYFNGTLWGFYTVIEQIDDQFLDWKIMDDDGNLFKAASNFGGGPGGGGDEADLEYYGTDQSEYETLYELKTNEEENDWSDLIALIDFINNSSDVEFENNLASHIELNEYLRSAAMDNLFSNLDSYTGSARNFYLYHNLESDKWEWIKWDANESFGSYGGGQGISDMTRVALNYHSSNRPLLENIFDNENLYNQYLGQVCYLTDNFFNSQTLDPEIDKIYNMIKASVYADTNKMYSDANFDTNVTSNISTGGGPMGGTTYGLKSFIEERSSYISGQVDCSLVSNIDQTHLNLDLKVYPNPTNGSLFIKWDVNESYEFTIYNSLGESVKHNIAIKNIPTEIDLTTLEDGVYYIEFNLISNPSISVSKRIMKF